MSILLIVMTFATRCFGIGRFGGLLLIFSAFLFASPAGAQVPGSCQQGLAQADLNVSDVLARVFNTGSLFYGNATTNGDGYLVPKFTGNSPVFAAGIWIGGLVDGEVRVAGSTYDRFEFWPGPLGDDGRPVDPDDCSPYDRIWVVDVFDIERYEEEGIASADLADWPVDLGAPVVDGDGIEGNYDIGAGDRPEVYGHQAAFWVMNDVGNVHRKTLTEPLGLEVRVTAFVSAEALLARQTFYRYEVVNKGPNLIEAGRFSLFLDPDLGDASDDLAGSDSTRSLAFTYNASEVDGNYGSPPPAVGYDLLTGASSSMYFVSADGPTGDPNEGIGMYNFMQALWGDGTPLTEFGHGFMTEGPVTTWAFPGDPESGAFWSEVNLDGNGASSSGTDRRQVHSSEPFVLAPGASRTFDVAILFAFGDDHLNSVTELKALSDAVQARYDADNLFVPSTLAFPDPGSLATPVLLAPEDGAIFIEETVDLSWAEVPAAEGYRVEISATPDFADSQVILTNETEASFDGIVNEVLTYYWRVQAGSGLQTSLFSDVRSFTYYRYLFDAFSNGTGIVEVAYPGIGDVCAGAPADPGCLAGLGNTVFADPSTTADYAITVSGDDLYDARAGDLALSGVTEGEDFELRFTEACATAGACLGAYVRDGGLITSVPFEVWNIGDAGDPSDDVRMIPVIRDHDGPIANWADAFTDEVEYLAADEDTVLVGTTEEVFFAQPDRSDGYGLFEAAANGFGGPGAVYDPENDGDEQIDLNASGNECARQNWYIDFCFRATPPFRFPIQDLVFADLAGDGTTPPAGTTIRFVSNDVLPIDTEDEVAQPSVFGITTAYPNPFHASATVEYTLGAAANARLAVYDILGRRVAILEEGPHPEGAHRATFEAPRLASGVYVVVLEVGSERHSRKLLLVR